MVTCDHRTRWWNVYLVKLLGTILINFNTGLPQAIPQPWQISNWQSQHAPICPTLHVITPGDLWPGHRCPQRSVDSGVAKDAAVPGGRCWGEYFDKGVPIFWVKGLSPPAYIYNVQIIYDDGVTYIQFPPAKSMNKTFTNWGQYQHFGSITGLLSNHEVINKTGST